MVTLAFGKEVQVIRQLIPILNMVLQIDGWFFTMEALLELIQFQDKRLLLDRPQFLEIQYILLELQQMVLPHKTLQIIIKELKMFQRLQDKP